MRLNKAYTPKILWRTSLSLLFTQLFACSYPTPPPVDTTNYGQLATLNQSSMTEIKKSDAINPIRIQALKESALSVGAQGALAKRSEEIDKMLAKNSRYLDQVFNFSALMLPNDVLPPVLLEGDNTINIADAQTLRISDKMYSIAAQARFVSAPPTWHDYLWMSFPKPDAPDVSILPKNAKEQKIWQSALTLGWKQGLAQGDTIFSDNVARLKRDYNGMVLYDKLVLQNMISLPEVAKTQLGVTGGGNALTVNDQIKRLTVEPTLNSNSNYWKPAIDSDNPRQTVVIQNPVLPPSPTDMGIK